jgi:apolipoprotein N-acyltransferase
MNEESSPGPRRAAGRPKLLPALGGLLAAAPFFPPSLTFSPVALVSFVGLVPLLLALQSARALPSRRRSWWSGFRMGWSFGAVFFLASLWWLGHVTVPGTLALCAYLALYPAIWAGCAALVRPTSTRTSITSALALAGLWCGLEWLRSSLLSGFPWNGIAVPLGTIPGLRDWAPLIGVTGTAFFPVAFQSLLVPLSHPRPQAIAVLTLTAIAFLPLAFPHHPDNSLPAIRVALLQPNVSMDDKMFGGESIQQQRYDDLIASSFAAITASSPDLIVWPESALPGWFHDAVNLKAFDALLASGSTLITGCDADSIEGAAPDDWNPRNCVALLQGDSSQFLLHAKVQLVPFGEFIPFRRQLPFLEKMLGNLIPRDFAKGTVTNPFPASGPIPSIIPLVCFEDSVGSHVRRFVRPEPQLIVNVTNDNWFHHSPAAPVHAINARWRCLELRRPMIRSANTGITCTIDTNGHISALPPFTNGVLQTSISPASGPHTPFARFGNLFSAIAGALGLAAITILARRRPAPASLS